ncbi:MAG: GNAT family N-acetyltransferase [Sedimenticola sp.]
MPSQPDAPIEVIRADLGGRLHADAFLSLLNAYAEEPVGAAAPLPSDVKERLVPALSAHPGTQVLLVVHDEQFAGFATCFTGFSTFRAKPLINIHDIYVKPELRGRGLASRLIAAAETLAREGDCCKLTLEVRDDNPNAERLYRRLGFGGVSSSEESVHYLFLEKPL